MLTCPLCHKPFTLTAIPVGEQAGVAPAPAPAASGHWFCPVHQRSKIVPAGTSQKTGKPYGAFWACTERDCELRPPRGFPVPSAAVPAPPVPIQPPPPAPSGLEPLPDEPRSDLEGLPF